jgi:hypothetical protein
MRELSEHLEEKHATNPLPGAPTVSVFCIGKIYGGQDRVFLF